MRKNEKWKHYDGQRPIMWDMTNISAFYFSHPNTQRSTFSKYYAENCFKGGVFCQLCGWLGNDNLWGGGVSDTDYNNSAGYMRDQKEFQELDLVFTEGDGVSMIVPFLNIFDRGYRAKIAVWLAGKQEVLQPPSSKGDERFRDQTTMYAATVTHDQSGNERAVNVCKRSALLKRGFKPGMNPIRFNCVWREWAFRKNKSCINQSFNH